MPNLSPDAREVRNEVRNLRNNAVYYRNRFVEVKDNPINHIAAANAAREMQGALDLLTKYLDENVIHKGAKTNA